MSQPKPSTDFDELPDDALIRLSLLLAFSLIPFSTSTLWRRVRANTFPKPVRLSPQVTAWRVGEIREWLKNPGEFVCQHRISHQNAKLEGVR
jgi:predicted DNA-binding transcriptional regulator AlpA